MVRSKVDEAYAELLRNQAAIDAYGWQVSRDDQAIYVLMHPRQHPERKFMLRIKCDDFDARPPSYQFVDPATKVVSVNHMPNGRGFIPAWPGVCIHGTREFYELGHRDYRIRWSSKEYPFARVLQEIQVLINQAYP
ncbi:MAG: hypothetical protein AB1563_02045 [Bacillota bacterium]